MDRTQAAKDFYESELSNPYSKQRDTAAFHLLGLELDSIEARYDGNSGAVGNYGKGIWVPPEEPIVYVELEPQEVVLSTDNGKDPFDGA